MPRRSERAEGNPRSALKTAGCCFAGLFEEKATRADVDKIIHRISLLEEKVMKCCQKYRQADEVDCNQDVKRKELLQKYCKERDTSNGRISCRSSYEGKGPPSREGKSQSCHKRKSSSSHKGKSPSSCEGKSPSSHKGKSPSSCEGKSPPKRKSSVSKASGSQLGSCELVKSECISRPNSKEPSKKPSPNSSYVKLACGCLAKKKTTPSECPPEISKSSSFEPEAAACETITKTKSPMCESITKTPTCESISKPQSSKCETILRVKSHTCEGIEVCPTCNEQAFSCCDNKCLEKVKPPGENTLTDSTRDIERVPCHKCEGIGSCNICNEQTNKCCASKCAISSPKPSASNETTKCVSNENEQEPNATFPTTQKRVSFTNSGRRDSSVNTVESEFLEAAAYESDDQLPVKTKKVKKKHSKKRITQDSSKKEVSTFTAECEGRWVSQPGITQSTQTCVLSETSLVSPTPSCYYNIAVNKKYDAHGLPRLKGKSYIQKEPPCNSVPFKFKRSDLKQIKSALDRNRSSKSLDEPAFCVSDANVSVMSSKKPSQMAEFSNTQFEHQIYPDDFKKKNVKYKKKRLKRTISGKRLKTLPNQVDDHKPYEVVIKSMRESSCRCVSNHSNPLRRYPNVRAVKKNKVHPSNPVDCCALSTRAPIIQLKSEKASCFEEYQPQSPTILKTSSNEQCNIGEKHPSGYKKVRIAENGQEYN